MRYWLDGDIWYPVYEFVSTPERLLFDNSWTPWLFFLGGPVRQFDGVEMSEPVVTDLVIQAVTIDDQGRIWVVSRMDQQEAALWLLE